MGRYLNLSDQGECIRAVLEIVPSGDSETILRTPKRCRPALEQGELDDLAEAYRSGRSIKDLVDQFEAERSTILKHLQAMDIPRRYPALDPDQSQEVCRLYVEGLNSTEIGRLFRVSADTVLRALRCNGVGIRQRNLAKE
jgi:DNA-directed RNA polymerase specialized sigma24 family protein